MDAIKFTQERNRMCKMYYEAGDDVCSDCPAKYEKCTMLEPMEIMTEDEIAKIVKIVEEWSAAHPRKTRQSVFLEMFPNVMKYENPHDGDIIAINPCCVDTKLQGHCPTGMGCDICRRKFWMQEVE